MFAIFIRARSPRSKLGPAHWPLSRELQADSTHILRLVDILHASSWKGRRTTMRVSRQIEGQVVLCFSVAQNVDKINSIKLFPECIRTTRCLLLVAFMAPPTLPSLVAVPDSVISHKRHALALPRSNNASWLPLGFLCADSFVFVLPHTSIPILWMSRIAVDYSTRYDLPTLLRADKSPLATFVDLTAD